MAERGRRHPRYEIETQALYRLAPPPGAPPPKAKGGRIRNLSKGGVLLEAEEYLPPGTRLSLLLIRGKKGTVEGQGEVVWAESPAGKPWLRHGVWITHMDPAQQSAWELFIDEASREIGRRPIRFDIDLALTCRRRDDDARWVGRAVNVSAGGFLVLLPIRFPLGILLSFEIQLPARTLKTDARVVRLEDPKTEGLIPHGLAYVDPEEGSRFLTELLFIGLL